MPDNPLERALDELYAVDAEDFVTTRKRLVSELRADGDRAGANELKAARRPSTAAWALNQLARQQPELVQALLERSDELRSAQSRPRSGDLDSLQDTIRAHRRAVADATDAARELLGARANDGFGSEITSTLRAASTDPAVGRELALGRLVREADGSAGFPDSAHLTLVPELPAEPTPEPVQRRNRAPRPDPEQEARHAATAARAALRQAEAEVQRRADLAARDDALARSEAATADRRRAEAQIAGLEAQLDAARRELRSARDRARDARAEAAQLSARLGEPSPRQVDTPESANPS